MKATPEAMNTATSGIRDLRITWAMRGGAERSRGRPFDVLCLLRGLEIPRRDVSKTSARGGYVSVNAQMPPTTAVPAAIHSR